MLSFYYPGVIVANMFSVFGKQMGKPSQDSISKLTLTNLLKMSPLSLGMTVFIVSTKGEHLLFVYCTRSSNRSVCHAISRFGRHLGPAWHTVPRSHVFSFSRPEAKHIVKIGIKQKDSDNSFKIRVPVQTVLRATHRLILTMWWHVTRKSEFLPFLQKEWQVLQILTYSGQI